MNTRELVSLLAIAVTGCATESVAPQSFSAAEAQLALSTEASPTPDGTLDGYLDHAVRHRAELRASLARWRSAVARIGTVDELPPLEVGYGYYLSRVETRVGPQRHRVRLQQGMPWPTRATRAEAVFREQTNVDEQRHSAALLEVRWQVGDAYWRLWEVERRLQWHREHEQLVRSLVDSVRGRVEVGGAALSDVGQAELTVSRTIDAIGQATELLARAALDLARASDLPASQIASLNDVSPRTRIPVESDDALVEATEAHPSVQVWSALQAAKLAEVDRVASSRYPDVAVGIEWMETGPAMDPTMPSSGRDAVVGSIGLRLPLWSGEVSAAQDVATAEVAMFAAEEDAAKANAAAAVLKTVSEIRDTGRRVRLFEKTLLPQAEAVLGSVRGTYEVGKAGVAALLLAQRELLELRLMLATLRAEHERHWAMLERLVGRPVSGKELP